MKTARTPVIGVMGGSTADATTTRLAEALGRAIARSGWILLNGGRNAGVMAASAKGAKEAGGLVIGILPDKTDAKASPHLDLAIMTAMGDGRNLINILSSDVVIACQGALGTLCEITFALKHNKPLITLGFSLGDDFARYVRSGRVVSAETADEAVARAKAYLNELS
ncbi:MAG: TIGR00725 family protein [Phycisphaerae bacterium]